MYVYRLEIGERGGVHIHMVINRIPDSDLWMEKKWKRASGGGHVYYAHIYEQGGMKKLAEYIVKQPTEEIYEQMSLFPDEDKKKLIKYNPSRNLKKPEPKVKKLKKMPAGMATVEPKPTKGYYIDKESIVCGVNPVTGKPYLHYIEYRIGYGEEDEDADSKHLHL